MSEISSSLGLRIASIFEIFVVSLFGICVPFFLTKNNRNAENDNNKKESALFKIMKSGSAGVMLGVALVNKIIK
jgi:hypothetical protein